jgi:hypothetical protein
MDTKAGERKVRMKCPPSGVNGPLTAPRPPVAEA